MAPINPQLHLAAVFNNKGFRNPAAYERNLGWESLLESQRFSKCLEAVRLFYVNIKRERGAEPALFSTQVYDHEITVTPTLLASLLGLPHSGHQAGFDGEFDDLGFDYDMALNVFTRDTGRHYPNQLFTGRLPDELKVFQFFITRCFLPRDLTSAELMHPSDLWIISNAKEGHRISYAHMLRFGDGNYSGPFPFGPYITRLLSRLGIDLRNKIIVCDVREALRPNHVLNRVDADVGRRKPVYGSGGVLLHSHLITALIDAAAAAVSNEIKRHHENLSSSSVKRMVPTNLLIFQDRLKMLQANQDDQPVLEPSSDSDTERGDPISDYDSPPDYPF
ncbi:unnamed protein product [Linum trigynum]|uniref:Uncharacterized protein n=1 Tax=Linum trigynum TaxID=586398 RepID=A0AAV2G930_9ROSI